MRRKKVSEFNTEVVEDILFVLGDARDWLIRKERAMQDILDALEEERMTFTAARLAVCLDYSEGHKNLHQCEDRLAGAAAKADFPYLHDSLRQDTLKFPGFRIVAPLPRDTA